MQVPVSTGVAAAAGGGQLAQPAPAPVAPPVAAPAPAPLPVAAAPVAGAQPAPPVSGGGAAIDMAAIVPVLQQLVQVITQLVTTLQAQMPQAQAQAGAAGVQGGGGQVAGDSGAGAGAVEGGGPAQKGDAGAGASNLCPCCAAAAAKGAAESVQPVQQSKDDTKSDKSDKLPEAPPLPGTSGGGAGKLDGDGLTVKGQKMSADQRKNLEAVLQVGKEMGASKKVMEAAVATVIQESNAKNDSSVDSKDHDSLGLFQQRPSMGWGTRAQISDPKYAAKKFFEKAIPNDKKNPDLAKTRLAQSVQISAYPDAYAKWDKEAEKIVADFHG
jgi:hypothetical protein